MARSKRVLNITVTPQQGEWLDMVKRERGYGPAAVVRMALDQFMLDPVFSLLPVLSDRHSEHAY